MDTSSIFDLTYKITFKKQLSYLIQPLSYLLLSLTISYLLFDFTKYFITIPCLCFVLDVLPALILHFQYLHKDFKATLTFDRLQNRIAFTKKGKTLFYNFQDIYRITKVQSSTYGVTNARHSFTNYYYYIFVFNDKSELAITCLLANDLEIFLSAIFNSKIETRFKLFPSIG